MALSKYPALHPAIINAFWTLANYLQIFILLDLSLSSIIASPANPVTSSYLLCSYSFIQKLSTESLWLQEIWGGKR